MKNWQAEYASVGGCISGSKFWPVKLVVRVAQRTFPSKDIPFIDAQWWDPLEPSDSG